MERILPMQWELSHSCHQAAQVGYWGPGWLSWVVVTKTLSLSSPHLAFLVVFYISQTISCYLSQIMDDRGHRHVQKAHVAKKITKPKCDLVSCSAARCSCVTASSPPRLNISKASPTKSRISPVVGQKCDTWCVPSKAVTLHCSGNITTMEV